MDRYERVIAVCSQSGEDLNAWLVGQGHAVAYRKYSLDYVPQEEAAHTERLGMWAGRFVMPWLWRRGERLQ
jgi:endonuclease YncB( thermonuclease family)